MVEQDVIVKLSMDCDGELGAKIEFDPGIEGEKSEAREGMTDDQKMIQNYAVYIASKIIEAIKNSE